MDVTPKKNSDPRRMVYLQKLNKATSRKPFLRKPPPITRQFDPLAIGDAVQLQNQTENHPTKWHNTGIIAEILPNRQYHVAVDGSRRVNVRNRKFLRRIDLVCRNIATEPTPKMNNNNNTPVKDDSLTPTRGPDDTIPVPQTDMGSAPTRMMSTNPHAQKVQLTVFRGKMPHQH